MEAINETDIDVAGPRGRPDFDGVRYARAAIAGAGGDRPGCGFRPDAVGTWEADHGNDLCIIRRDGDTGYAITHVSGGSVRQF